MSARESHHTIEWLARLGIVVGIAACVAAAGPNSAWSGCGGGGGGGGGNKSPSTSAPPEPQKNDPIKVRQLKDLTKKLKAELHLDNQKSKSVQVKELEQTELISKIMKDLPNQDDPVYKDAESAIVEWAAGNNFSPK